MIELGRMTKSLKRMVSFYMTIAKIPSVFVHHYTVLGTVDIYANELEKYRNGARSNVFNKTTIRLIEPNSGNCKSVSEMNDKQLDELILKKFSQNKHKELERLVAECLCAEKVINEMTLIKLISSWSESGKRDLVSLLINYAKKIDPDLYIRHGELSHYLAKAQCLKGNSEKGLILLEEAYKKHVSLRPIYRKLFRELIHDSISNRSVASLVIFKKYVLKFSEVHNDHYPLICLWHFCWSSTWFSDQIFSNELLDSCETLRGLVKNQSCVFTINILKKEHNDDPVVRLLQFLIKYDMKEEYGNVLRILFNFKLKNEDVRACSEIIRNCEMLDIELGLSQKQRYIDLIIQPNPSTKKPTLKEFKLKF